VNGFERSRFTETLAGLAKRLPRPQVVWVVAHWLTRGSKVYTHKHPERNIQSFHGAAHARRDCPMLKCQVKNCTKVFKNPKALAMHMRQTHDNPNSELFVKPRVLRFPRKRPKSK
jgi:hypothetical protein